MSGSSSDDDDFGAIGFMFDGAAKKVTKKIQVTEDLCVSVRCIDEEPGAVQSGHFLWPGATVLLEHLYEHRSSLPTGRVLELGAGCGLVGLGVASFLPECSSVALTDHDPGVLDLIKEAVRLLPSTAAPCSTDILHWGSDLPEQLSGPFDLVVASDVFYADTVVLPLLTTVSKAMRAAPASFYMMTSIEEPLEIQQAIENACRELNFTHSMTILRQVKKRIFRLHIFQKASQ